MNILIYIFVGLFGLSFLSSTVLAAVVCRLANKVGFVAQPRIDRYNTRTVAMGGGIGIFINIAGFLAAAIFGVRFLLLQKFYQLRPDVLDYAWGFASKVNQLIVLLGCLLVLFVLGLIDDKKHLGPFVKLIVQFAAAFIAAFYGDMRVELFIDNIYLTSAMSAVWIVLIINAFNFLDNMDGLSAGIAAIVSSILFFASAKSGQVFVSGLAIVFVGTLLGFLVFNFPPAKIFMGDAGSLIVGFLAAVLTLKTTYYHQTDSGPVYSIFMPLIVMAVPLYDFISVSFLRIRQGKSPFVGDTQHFSHRIKRRGFTDTQTAITLYLATLCCGISAIFLYKVGLVEAILIFIQTLMILIIIAILESSGGKVGQTTDEK